MRNKIFTILGILIILVSLAAYFVFDLNIRRNSNSMGLNVLFAKENMPEGLIINDINTANKYFSVKRVTQAEIVPNAIKVNVARKAVGDTLLEKIQNYFTPNVYSITPEDLKNLVKHKVTQPVYKNQQIINTYLSTDLTEYADDDRLFAVPTSYVDAVGAEVRKGDYIDLWVSYSDKARLGQSEKVIGPLRVVKLKDANNAEIAGNNANLIPKVVLVKVDEEQVKLLKEKLNQGSIFMVKYGMTPSAPTAVSLPTSPMPVPVSPAAESATMQQPNAATKQ